MVTAVAAGATVDATVFDGMQDRANLVTVKLLDREVQILTDEKLGVAGRPWPAQEVAARATCRLLPSVTDCALVVELGAGCGALAIALAQELAEQSSGGGGGSRVVATDLPEVLPLLEQNCTRAGARGAPAPECCALAWGDLDAIARLAGKEHGGSCLVVACECAYWGGWTLFEDDTREPLTATLDALIAEKGLGLLVHQVRDAEREASLYTMLESRGLELRREEPPGQQELREGEIGIWTLRRRSG